MGFAQGLGCLNEGFAPHHHHRIPLILRNLKIESDRRRYPSVKSAKNILTEKLSLITCRQSHGHFCVLRGMGKHMVGKPCFMLCEGGILLAAQAVFCML